MLGILAITLFVFGGCSEDIAAPVVETLTGDVQSKQLNVVTEDGVTTYEGVFGGENLYEILVPEDWNGELVVYAHGFVDAGEPLTLPTKDNAPEIRDAVVEGGFAWAWCSYRENGMAVKDGAWATRQLTKIFGASVKSKPTYTWLMGNSLGGLIAVELAETHASEFDGVVTLNGMIGGTKVQLDYVAHVRILFDLFYPGVLTGSVLDVPEIFDLNMDVVYPVIQAVQADPTGLGIISRVKQTPLPGRNGDELVESLITALAFNFRGIHDVLERTGGACPIDNYDTVYEAAGPGLLPPEVLAMINAAVQRYDRSIPTDELFDRYYEPSGNLAIPMVAVHNAFDPVVHKYQEDLYAAKVQAMGYGQNLDQRVIERYAHTDFPAAEAVPEAVQALADLRVKVVTSGTMVYTD
jgi:pimeloyl-ACP methyl ester carboxylesterase